MVDELINQPIGVHVIGNINVWSFDSQVLNEQRLHLGDMIQIDIAIKE